VPAERYEHERDHRRRDAGVHYYEVDLNLNIRVELVGLGLLLTALGINPEDIRAVTAKLKVSGDALQGAVDERGVDSPA
jgi:hypothetical protein